MDMVPRSPPATLPKLGRCGRSMVGHFLASHLVHPDFWWHMVTLFSGKTSHLVWPMRWSRAHSEQTYWENMRNHDEKNSWSAPGPRIDHTAHTNTKRIGINPLCLCQEHTRISNLLLAELWSVHPRCSWSEKFAQAGHVFYRHSERGVPPQFFQECSLTRFDLAILHLDLPLVGFENFNVSMCGNSSKGSQQKRILWQWIWIERDTFIPWKCLFILKACNWHGWP